MWGVKQKEETMAAAARTLGKMLRETGQALDRFGLQCVDSPLVQETCELRVAGSLGSTNGTTPHGGILLCVSIWFCFCPACV